MRPFWKNTVDISSRLAAAPRLLVTLDFDGTLSALAKTPGQARLKPEVKAALKALAAARGVSVFVLSGRALESVRRLVGLRNLYYGGNHGMEIKGPGFSWRDAGAAKARSLVAGLAAGLRERFPPATGVLVENKGFSASVHYRNLKAPYRRGFFSGMRALMQGADKRLRWNRGHKVFELRPAGAPHKGDAVVRLAKKLGTGAAFAVGDDLTDEDMFKTLRGRGITVRVGRRHGSAAGFFVQKQQEVLRLLEFTTSARRAQ